MSEPPSPRPDDKEAKLSLLGIEFGRETLLLASAPVVSYFIAYAYEDGYCGSFGIPSYLIDVNISTIFTVIVILVASYCCVHSLLHQYVIPTAQWVYPRITFYYTYWLAVLAVLSVLYPLPACILFAVVILIFYADHFQARSNKEQKGSVVQKLRLRRDAIKKDDVQRAMAATKHNAITIALFVVFMVYGLSNWLGSLTAEWQVNYNLLVSDRTLLLIYIKDGRAICAKYDPETKHIDRRMVIVPLSDKNNTEIVAAGIGPLRFH